MTLKAKAYAKINLFLQVKEKRHDGYHELDTIMQSVGIFDELSLTLTDCNTVRLFCDNKELCDDNIVFSACRLFFELYGKSFGADIALKKNIPVAAGLAGGSADAAATLLLLNRAVGNRFSTEELLPIATKLGADVPFCLVGGTKRCRGIGEIISEVRSNTMHYVLLKEGSKKSTGQMFSVLDNSDYKPKNSITDFISSLESFNLSDTADKFFNSFEICWDVSNMTAPFIEHSPLGVFLSGSGPTVGALFENRFAAEACFNSLKNDGYNAYLASSVQNGVDIE